MELVRQAIQMDGRSRSELTQAMKKLTELENPNSVQQMKQWLADNGVETDTLGKKLWQKCSKQPLRSCKRCCPSDSSLPSPQ